MNLQQRIAGICADPQFTPITEMELVEVLRNLKGSAQFCGFQSITKRTDLNKYDNYFIQVGDKKKKNPNAVANPYFEDGIYNFTKKANLITGFDYVASVEGRMEREGLENDFVGGESWHRAISRSLSVHKNNPEKFYFRYQYLDNSNQVLEYYHKNDPIAYAMFQSFLQTNNHYSNQQKQGLTDVLQIQVISIENLITININKEKYRVVHPHNWNME